MLAQQPFETVMQTGFKDYLNHLTTKLTVRRSDIIVSSTLSITLTPIDDGFVPTHFALIESEEIWDYVMLKNAYRSSLVSSNSLPKLVKKHFQESSQSDEEIGSMSDPDIDSFFEENQEEAVLSENSTVKLRLPSTLLSQPLTKH
mgnify:CR=1 FL=1